MIEQDSKKSVTTRHHFFAAFFNWSATRPSSLKITNPLRKETAGKAYGRVLELGAGSGLNFTFYTPDLATHVDAIEPDLAMSDYARQRIATAAVPIDLHQVGAESLPFSDHVFDSAVATLVFCSVSDPIQSLAEIRRVLKPGATLFLFEHVRSSQPVFARLQDLITPLSKRVAGNCHWNRDTEHILKDAGFQIQYRRKMYGGMQPVVVIHAISQ